MKGSVAHRKKQKVTNHSSFVGHWWNKISVQDVGPSSSNNFTYRKSTLISWCSSWSAHYRCTWKIFIVAAHLNTKWLVNNSKRIFYALRTWKSISNFRILILISKSFNDSLIQTCISNGCVSTPANKCTLPLDG